MRFFDHCVLPVADLSTARQRLSALGFTVAADASHPFGTQNACVYFADDTYLEPLAIGQPDKHEQTASKGNQFTFRDQVFRFRNGENGFSAIAMKTDSADKDHKSFQSAGFSAGRKLLFGRTMMTPDEQKARATFKLAFAADARSPDSFAFACERVGIPKVDRSALQRHANTVTGIAEIIASEPKPADFQGFLQAVIDTDSTKTSADEMTISIGNSVLRVLMPHALETQFGTKRSAPERGLRYEAIVFNCSDLNALHRHCVSNNVDIRSQGDMLIVDKQDGQGAAFAFKQE